MLLPLARVGVSVGVFAFGPLSPLLQGDLGLSRLEVGSLITALELGAFATTLPAAHLVDRYGVRLAFPASQALLGLGLLALASAGSVNEARAAALVAGLGHGVMTPALSKAVLDWFPPQRRGFVLGLLQSAGPLAALLAGVVLPPLALAAGWRGALVLAGVLALGSSLAFALCYREDRTEPRGETDLASPGRLWSLVASRDAWLLGACTAIFGGVYLALVTFLVLYLTEAQRWPLVTASLALALTQVVGGASVLAWGVLSDRALGGRRKPLLLVGAILGCVGGGVLAATPEGAPAFLLLWPAVLLGVAALGYSGLMLTLVGESARRSGVATAVGFNLTLGYAGFVGGAPLFGALADQGGYGAAWLATAAAFLVALALLAPVREPTRAAIPPDTAS